MKRRAGSTPAISHCVSKKKGFFRRYWYKVRRVTSFLSSSASKPCFRRRLHKIERLCYHNHVHQHWYQWLRPYWPVSNLDNAELLLPLLSCANLTKPPSSNFHELYVNEFASKTNKFNSLVMRAAAKNPKINIVAVNDPFIPVQYVSGLNDATDISCFVVVGEICGSFDWLSVVSYRYE